MILGRVHQVRYQDHYHKLIVYCLSLISMTSRITRFIGSPTPVQAELCGDWKRGELLQIHTAQNLMRVHLYYSNTSPCRTFTTLLIRTFGKCHLTTSRLQLSDGTLKTSQISVQVPRLCWEFECGVPEIKCVLIFLKSSIRTKAIADDRPI